MKKLLCAFSLLMIFSFTGIYAQNDMLTQFSIIDALLNGVYDGNTSMDQLSRYGDFGLGTFNALDGEMVILNGNVYKVRSDGKVIKQDGAEKTPFAVAVNFKADNTYRLNEPVNMKQLIDKIDSLIPSQNYFYALKIKGRFSAVQTRSVPKQNKPYKPLAEVVKKQTVFNFKNIDGTIVGFRCPPFVKGINVPGYHLHFLSDDLSAGGHVLDFSLEQGDLYIDSKSSFQILLPGDEEFKSQNFSADKESELMKVEKK